MTAASIMTCPAPCSPIVSPPSVPLYTVVQPTVYFPSRSCTFVQAAAPVLNTSANSFVFFKVQIGVASSRKPSLVIISFTSPCLSPPGWSPSVLSIIGLTMGTSGSVFLCLLSWTVALNTGDWSWIFKSPRTCGSVCIE